MTVKNNLREILEDHGFKKISPTKTLLGELQMSSIRFFQIYENKGKRVIDAREIQNLKKWLETSFKGSQKELVSVIKDNNSNG